MPHKVEKKFSKGLDYDPNQCECTECHQKRKYNRGKRIFGHTPPVVFKRSFVWYKVVSTDGGAAGSLFYALCPHSKRFAKTTQRPDIVALCPPFLIGPAQKRCDEAKNCRDVKCELCGNEPSAESDRISQMFEELKGSL